MAKLIDSRDPADGASAAVAVTTTTDPADGVPVSDKADPARRRPIKVKLPAAEEGGLLVPEVRQVPVSPRKGPAAAGKSSSERGEAERIEKIETVLRSLPLPEAQEALASKSRLSPEEYRAALQRLWDKRQASVHAAAAEMRDDAKTLKEMSTELLDPSASTERKQQVLLNMDYLVGYIDNARDWVKLGGLDACMALLDARHPNAVLAPYAALVIGTAAKNDKVVQRACVVTGAVGVVVKALREPSSFLVCNSDSSAKDGSACQDDAFQLPAKLMYALSAIVRSNPEGQQSFLAEGGLVAVAETAARASEASEGPCRVRIKSISLVDDLLAEHSTQAVGDAGAEGDTAETRANARGILQGLRSGPW